MPVEQATPPECRSGARAATGAGLHWCCEPPVAAAPGLMRDGTGSGSWSCRRGCIRADAGPVALLAAMTRRHAARPETARLVLAPDRQPKLCAQRVSLLD